jgi:hypothetical protein
MGWLASLPALSLVQWIRVQNELVIQYVREMELSFPASLVMESGT